MTRKNEIRNELEQLSPSLAKLKAASQNNSRELPQGYFEILSATVESQIFEKVTVEKENNSKVLKLWWYAGVAVAASVALFFLTNTSRVEVEYPKLETLSINEQIVVDELDLYDLEYLLDEETYTHDIDVENILLEENNLEDLINI